jgi:tetratricopeptide (TPR) repeat protein
MELKNVIKAKEYFQQAVIADDQLSQSHYYLGRLSLEMDELDKALNHLLKAAELAPNDIDIQYQLGKTYVERKQYEQAVLHLERASLRSRDDIRPSKMLGDMHYLAGNYVAAYDYYDICAMQEPENPEFEHRKGLAAYKANDLDLAIECLNKAYEIDPFNWDILQHLASAYLNDLDYNMANFILVNAPNEVQEEAQYHLLLGKSYKGLKDRKMAKYHFNMAFEKDPSLKIYK